MKPFIYFTGKKSNYSNIDVDEQQQQQQDAKKQQQGRNFGEDIISGFVAGAVAVSLGFPLDVIKTRMQTSHTTSQREGKSIFKTARGIVRHEGYLGLYKGLAAPLLTLSVSSSISFTSYKAFRDFYKAQDGWHAGNMLSGLSCGPIVGVISTVENHVRTQMQIDNIQKNRFDNSLHCKRYIVRNHGWSTLFSGWAITTMKDCAHFGTYFFVYEGVKGTLLEQHKNSDPGQANTFATPKAAAIPMAGGVAGIAAWLVAYPLDCVRAGLHGQSLKRGPSPKGYEVFRDLLENRGIRGLYAGVTPTLMRAALVHSARFSVYESLLWLFRTFGDQEQHSEQHTKKSSSSSFGFLTPGRNR